MYINIKLNILKYEHILYKLRFKNYYLQDKFNANFIAIFDI